MSKRKQIPENGSVLFFLIQPPLQVVKCSVKIFFTGLEKSCKIIHKLCSTSYYLLHILCFKYLHENKTKREKSYDHLWYTLCIFFFSLSLHKTLLAAPSTRLLKFYG